MCRHAGEETPTPPGQRLTTHVAPSSEAQRPTPYRGEDLGPRPHVAVLFRDQIGDFLVATPLMRGLRERYPDMVLDYFGGERTRELEEASRLVDARYSLYGAEAGAPQLLTFLDARREAAGPYTLAINLESDPAAAQAAGAIRPRFICGTWAHPETGLLTQPPSDGIDRLWHDTWNRADLLTDYPILSTQFIGEIFCRLCRVETAFSVTEAPIEEPPLGTPPILISTGASRSAKLWPTVHWARLVEWLLRRGEEVGLLGAAPGAGASGYHSDDADSAVLKLGAADLRGTLTLPQVAGALRRARAFVTVDNGLMHLAAAVGTPTLALFGASPRRLWAPVSSSVQTLDPDQPCTLCEENRFRNQACLLPVHQCMLSVTPERVENALTRHLRPH